jgi:hypothetical protein
MERNFCGIQYTVCPDTGWDSILDKSEKNFFFILLFNKFKKQTSRTYSNIYLFVLSVSLPRFLKI